MLKYILLKGKPELSAFLYIHIVVPGEAVCAQAYAVGFVGIVKCLQTANSKLADEMCERWVMIIVIFLFLVQHRCCAGTELIHHI